MLRKTIIAAALAAASLAPAAEAADVRMYGIIDTGIIVENNRNGVNGTESTARSARLAKSSASTSDPAWVLSPTRTLATDSR